MISERARQSVDGIFTRAAISHLAVRPGDTVTVERVANAMPHSSDEKMVVLTISSFMFRLMTFFRVDTNGASGRYFSGGEGASAFAESFGEIGNLCCGAMNRELAAHFPHLGLSTPSLLESKCAAHLDALRPGYVAHHRIAINDDIRLHATLCLCAYSPLDFHVVPAGLAESCGTVELF